MNGGKVMYVAIDETEDWKTLGVIDADDFHDAIISATKAMKMFNDSMQESKKNLNDIRSEDFYNRGGPGDFRKRGRKR